jgi:nucleotide-binding universal stress UspA family protein
MSTDAKTGKFPRIERAVVALGLEATDRPLLDLAACLSRGLGVRHVHLALVSDRNRLPPEVQALMGPKPSEAQVRDAMVAAAKSFDWGSDATLETNLGSENRELDLLKLTNDLHADLLCVGSVGRSGQPMQVREQRIAQGSPCTVLTVPNNERNCFDTILVPVDFSAHSREALAGALAIAEANENCDVIAVYVYDVPNRFDASGLTFDEFADKLRGVAQVQWAELVRDMPAAERASIRYDLIPHSDRSHEVSHVIDDVANEIDADLIVLGSQGWTALARMLVGSTVTGLLGRTARPVLCVKNKGETRGLLDFLLGG